MARMTKGDLNQLACLTNLQALDAGVLPEAHHDPQVDEAMLDLSRLTNLRRISLGVSLQDPDLACLSALHHLEWLSIGGEISEEGLRYFKGLWAVRIAR